MNPLVYVIMHGGYHVKMYLLVLAVLRECLSHKIYKLLYSSVDSFVEILYNRLRMEHNTQR